MADISRRELLGGSAALGAATLATAYGWPAESSAAKASRRRRSSGTSVILLGTAGGPRIHLHRASPSQVIVSNGVPYLIDCGEGVLRRLVAAGIQPAELRHIFIGHHHSDHIADYGNALLLAWATGLRRRVDVWGPPPLVRMTEAFFEYAAFDIDTRIEDEGRVPLRPLIEPHEFEAPEGVVTVMEDENVRVSAVRVNHPPVFHTYAYRFDSEDRSIVISNDTTPWEPLIELARGADVLVHEALYEPGLDVILAKVPNADRLKEHILASHTKTEDVGRIAQRAGVGTLVLSHLVPADDGAVPAGKWTQQAKKDFDGRVILGRDLLEV